METFAKLFSSLLAFVYHCFDRIVIQGYLPLLTRPENIVHFFRDVQGIYPITKEVLGQRTREYQQWVEAFTRNRILRRQRTRFTHYYFYIRDEVLGPMVVCVSSFLPFQTTYYLNGHHFIEGQLQRLGIRYRKDDNAFLWVEDVPALQAAADRLTAEAIRQRLDYWTLVVGPKFSKKDRAAISLRRHYSINQIEYGPYWRSSIMAITSCRRMARVPFCGGTRSLLRSCGWKQAVTG